MQRPAEPALRGAGHCCVCATVCHHIGPIRLCERHQTAESPDEMLMRLDVELAPEWGSAITASLDSLFTKRPR